MLLYGSETPYINFVVNKPDAIDNLDEQFAQELIESEFLKKWYNNFIYSDTNPVKNDVVLCMLWLLGLQDAIIKVKAYSSLATRVPYLYEDLHMMDENIHDFKEYFYDSLDIEELFAYRLDSTFIKTLDEVLYRSPEVWRFVLHWILLFQFNHHKRFEKELEVLFWNRKEFFVAYRKDISEASLKKYATFMSLQFRQALKWTPSKFDNQLYEYREHLQAILRGAHRYFEEIQKINEKRWFTSRP